MPPTLSIACEGWSGGVFVDLASFLLIDAGKNDRITAEPKNYVEIDVKVIYHL